MYILLVLLLLLNPIYILNKSCDLDCSRLTDTGAQHILNAEPIGSAGGLEAGGEEARSQG